MRNVLEMIKEKSTAGHSGCFKVSGGAPSASRPRRLGSKELAVCQSVGGPGGFPNVWLSPRLGCALSFLTFVMMGKIPHKGRDVCVLLYISPVCAIPNICSILLMHECGGQLRLFSYVATPNITLLSMLSIH